MSIERILIVGSGSIGTRHLWIAQMLFPSSVIRVLSHRPKDSHLDQTIMTLLTIEEVFEFGPQIAIIAGPSSHHLGIAQKLAERGVHLFIEKPISSSPAGVQNLIETCKGNNLVLAVGYNLRYSQSLGYFKMLLDNQIIGKVLSVRCEVGQYLPSWRPEGDYRFGVSARRELGGGVLLELSHEIDYLSWLFGKVIWVRSTLSRQSSMDIDVEDSAHLTLGFMPNGINQGLIATANLDFIRHDQTRVCTAIGENGSLRWDGINGDISIFEAGGPSWKELYRDFPQRNETYLSEWQDFINCINNGGLPGVTGEDGLAVIEIIEAVRKSSITGKQVDLIHKRGLEEPVL